MGIPQSNDPLMMLGTAKNANGGAENYRTTPTDTPDRTLAEKFQSDQNTAQNVDFGGGISTPSGSGFGGPPAGVDKYNGGLV